MNWIDRTYMGQERLWKVFWLGYMAPLLPLTIALGIFKETVTKLSSWVSFGFVVILLIYQAWLAIAMWRCAPNVKHEVFFFLGRVFATILAITAAGGVLQFIKGTS